MKFAVKCLAILAAGGLLMGVTGASAGGKSKDHDVVKLIDADLKRVDAGLRRLDKEVFGWLRRDHKR